MTRMTLGLLIHRGLLLFNRSVGADKDQAGFVHQEP